MNRHLLCLFAFLSTLSLACTTDNPVDPGSTATKLTLGAERTLGSQSIGTGGGILTIPATADTLGGLEVELHSGGYPESRTVSVSFAPIIGGADGIEVLSPAIIIENGGGYAEELMTVKVPVRLPDDMFAMAFAYDETNGGFEAVPLLDYDATSVTLWSMHFEHSAIHDPALGKGVRGGAVMGGRKRSILVIIAEKKEVVMTASVSTNFKVGVDNWQFPNKGSNIATNGHCAGQTLGMLYYYVDHRLKGEPALNGRFDNDQLFATPEIWEDDQAAYRYCSVLQTRYRDSFNPMARVEALLARLGRTESFRDSLMFMAFKLAMHRSKSPQFLGVRGDGGVGHAIAVFGATSTTLSVVDPNNPTDQHRSITFGNGRFDPYLSGTDASSRRVNFTRFYFYGTTSGMNWSHAKEHWPGVPAKTAGITLFPTYAVKVQDSAGEAGKPMVSGWRSRTGRARFFVESQTDDLEISQYFLADGTKLTLDAEGWITVPAGRNQIGLYIVDLLGEWTAFKWFEIADKNAPAPPRCSRDKVWETVLGPSHFIGSDSTSRGRHLYFEDLGTPEDICSDVHVHPVWQTTGDLSGLTLVASAYWSLFGDEKPLTVTGSTATATMEIGLKQAFGDKPAWVGLQLEVIFPSRGSLDADLAWFRSHNVVTRIVMPYKEHAQ
jgi:hypothetical protein